MNYEDRQHLQSTMRGKFHPPFAVFSNSSIFHTGWEIGSLGMLRLESQYPSVFIDQDRASITLIREPANLLKLSLCKGDVKESTVNIQYNIKKKIKQALDSLE